MSKKYYLTQGARNINIAGSIFLIIAATAFSILIYYDPSDPSIRTVPPVMIWAIFLLVVLPLYTGVATLIRMKKPEVEMTEAGLRLYRGHRAYLTKVLSLAWTDIVSIAVQNEGAQATKSIINLSLDKRVVKILIRHPGLPQEATFALAGIEETTQLIADLKEKVPDVKFTDLLKTGKFSVAANDAAEEIRFRRILLDRQGLHKKTLSGDELLSSWGKIRSIVVQSRGLSLVGYYPVEITYIGSEGAESRTVVNPRISGKFLSFLRYLASHSELASIDPTIMNMLEYRPKDAWFDVLLLLPVITALFIQFGVIWFMGHYVPLSLMVHFSLLVLVFTIAAGYMTVRYIYSRASKGVRYSTAKKAIWSVITSLTPVAVSLAFLFISPVTRYHASAAFAMKRHDLQTANKFFRAAIALEPDDLNINFNMGVYYRETGRHDLAVVYLEKVNSKRLCWRGPEAAMLLPDSLFHLNRNDEALAWCTKMQKCGVPAACK